MTQHTVSWVASVFRRAANVLPASNEIVVVNGRISGFRHPDGPEPGAGQVWVVWALAGTGLATVEVPVQRERVEVISVDGHSSSFTATAGRVRRDLKGDRKMPPSILVVDRLSSSGR